TYQCQRGCCQASSTAEVSRQNIGEILLLRKVLAKVGADHDFGRPTDKLLRLGKKKADPGVICKAELHSHVPSNLIPEPVQRALGGCRTSTGTGCLLPWCGLRSLLSLQILVFEIIVAVQACRIG